MKTERRHELQQNELADWIGNSYESAKPYSKTIGAGIVALVIIGGVVWFLMGQSASKRTAAWNDYFKATNAADLPEAEEQLRAVTEKHPGTPAAYWAEIYFADRGLAEGLDGLFTDRDAANELLNEAVEIYHSVYEATSEPTLRERAAYGMGQAYEGLAQREKAQEAYARVLESAPDGLYAMLAQERINDLEQNSTKDFYTWFAKFEPPPKTDEPGTPGVKPDFAEPLPDSPDAPGGTGSLLGPSLNLSPAGDTTAPVGDATAPAENSDQAAAEPAAAEQATPPATGELAAPEAGSAEQEVDAAADAGESAAPADDAQQ